MVFKFFLLPLLLLLFGGCSIVLLPYTAPISFFQDRLIHFEATVTDSDKRPLQNAKVETQECFAYPNLDPGLYFIIPYALIEPTANINSTSTISLPGGRFRTNHWASGMTFNFSAPGYYPRTFSSDGKELHEWLPEDGRSSDVDSPMHLDPGPLKWPLPYTVTLDRIEHPANLIHYNRWPAEDENHQTEFIDLDVPNIDAGPLPTFDPRSQTPAANSLFISVERDASDHFLRKRSNEPDTLNSLKLNCSSNDGGLLRVPMDHGRPVGGRIRMAPETGYAPDLKLDALDLQTLHQTGVLFFIKKNSIYGRGNIHFLLSNGPRVTLCMEVFLQPDGSRNVE